ncbi:hypothetical protein PCC8801_1722 [Rippkaea orientalis PCC 8801]|uniref:Glycoside hydrolase family 42 N-terminal domain-containing protein n=1 Tax=Rippkaea orientalis (strain PCC 8801 / RF-1) TaxID=41431 RepID=B7JWS0_RIPO1|nr:hypothetical protein PCC8801_1722 [Rippkaea orientalis PCC 8801]
MINSGFRNKAIIPYLTLVISLTIGISSCQDISDSSTGKIAFNNKAKTVSNQQTIITEDNTWPFEPGIDNYSDKALLDLRYLNEKVAGEKGFIQRSKDGNDFVTGDGTPIRFWAINSEVWKKGYSELKDNARFLAKRGVNLVRWHGQIAPKIKDSKLINIDTKSREQLWQYVAAMKQEGIYLTISPYYANALKPQPNWKVPQDSQSFHGLLFFDPELQKAYKSWLKQLLIPVNPYTGIALKDEPAIAIIQLQNEDSLLFWTFNQLKGREKELLSRQFSQWLQKKYGSLTQASNAWQGTKVKGDDLAKGIVQLYNISKLTKLQKSNDGKAKRLADQTQFLTETMRQFNQEMTRFLREEIGAKQLINAGNWKTADTLRLNDAERYSYSPTEVMAVNRYYTGGTHQGKYKGWAIVNGDKFTNQSVLFNPLAFPLNIKQVSGYPMIIPESSWVPPLGYQSEGPFLVSLFQSLTGIDGFYWFAMKEPQWREPSSANGYKPSLGKWVINTPELLGNFPAAALMYRQNYIKMGSIVIDEKRSLDELWSREIPLISETTSFDPNRDKNEDNSSVSLSKTVNPLAFLVGRVQVSYNRNSSESQVLDLSPYIDEKAKTIRSITGEIQWNYSQGICTLNTPKAQGVSGFLAQVGEIKLGDTTIISDNQYGTVIIVSMDGKPLKTSQKILVQMGTVARSTGWQEKAITWENKQGKLLKGFEIINYGKAPWRLLKNELKITINNPNLTQGTILNPNGLAQGKIEIKRDKNKIIFDFPVDSKYLILEEK